MARKEYGHLVKPLRIQDPPSGLYGKEPRVWMEGKDLEGFNAHFTFGFIKEPVSCHPREGMLVHPYDECLVFAGIDYKNIHNLGAEISIGLGDEEHVFSDPTVIVIPKGTPHGPISVKRVERPFVHYGFGLAPEYKATTLAAKPPVAGSNYGHLVKRLITHIDPNRVGTGMGYERVVDKDGVLRPADRGIGPGNANEYRLDLRQRPGGARGQFHLGLLQQVWQMAPGRGIPHPSRGRDTGTRRPRPGQPWLLGGGA